MIAELKFNLPDEAEEFRNATEGGKYKEALREFDNYLRSIVKYSNVTSLDPAAVRHELHTIIDGHGVSIWD